jgi:hypothetical protein
MAVLERAVGLRNAVFGEKADRAVECNTNRFIGALSRQKFAGLGEVEDGHSKREFKDRLHGRVMVRMQITIKRSAGKKA